MIAPSSGEGHVSAYRGWVMWQSEDGPVLWRAEQTRRFAPSGAGPSGPLRARLGSDARGRTAVAYLDCAKPVDATGRGTRCHVVQQVLATGAERNLVRVADTSEVYVPEISRGALCGSPRRPRSRPTWSPAGSSTRDTTGTRTPASVARAIDLRGGRPRLRTLARHHGEHEDGRLGQAVTTIDTAANDGRYAYWVRTTSGRSEVWRADLGDPRATLDKCTLGRPAWSIEVTDPAWQDTGLRTPVAT